VQQRKRKRVASWISARLLKSINAKRSSARGNTQRGIQEIRQAATLQCQVSKHKDGVRFV